MKRFARSAFCQIGLLVVTFAYASSTLAQTKTQRQFPAISAAADRLGMTCAQILDMASTDWMAKFTQTKGSAPDSTNRATSVYGKCYDARTDSIAAALTTKNSGPNKKARADFLNFDAAVKKFAAKALADAQPTPDATKSACVVLYELQFRRELYREYEEKTVNRSLTSDESDQYRKAKNRFGELIGLLPEDKGHEVHRAFGDILDSQPFGLTMNLALYRYAIFILEPPSEKPFAPPPF